MTEPLENLCVGCDSPVYQAEGVAGAGGRKYHKRCHKCCSCNKLLSTVTATFHQGQLYCKTCHAHANRAASPALFSDTTKIKPEKESEACPKCGGSVFEAEKVVEKGQMYHRRCFVCCRCSRPQSDKLQVFVGFDQRIYCEHCYPKIKPTPLDLDTSKIKADEGQGCPRCQGKVFETEKISTKSGVYHKRCFTCKICHHSIDNTTNVEHEKEVYCKSCFSRNFEARSKSVGPCDTRAIKGDGDEACPRCGGAVFEAEKIVSRKHFYHKGCINCNNCKHILESSTFFDAPDGEVYCKACYAVLFGHKRGKSVGPPTDVRSIPAPEGDISRCPRCGGKVFEAEKALSSRGWYHLSCFRCSRCDANLDTKNQNYGTDGQIYCNGCYFKIKAQDNHGDTIYAKSISDTTSILANEGEFNACPRCEGKVFEAERMVAKSGIYHRKCFSCDSCRHILDSSNVCDGPEGEILCKACYGKKYHITEMRLVDADKVLNTSLIKAENEESGCPRCGGAVFHAEMVMVNGKSFHKKCCKCGSCEIHLDTITLTNGPDGEIYCKNCHSKTFESTGYHMSDPASIKAEPGSADACTKCDGKVYELEKISSTKSMYHKSCFKCNGCKKNLDSTSVYTFEAPDDQVYCKKCFVDHFGHGKTPLPYLETTSIQPNDGKGCPRCGGSVFKAEEIIEKGNNYHKSCFTCKKCDRPQADRLQVFIGFDEEIYCKNCCPNVQHTPIGINQDTSKIQGDAGGFDACPRCNGKVFAAEQMASRNHLYHKKCFTCKNCNSILSLSSMYDAPDKEIYCKLCYLKVHFTGGQNLYLDCSKKVESDGTYPACKKCNVNVYENEQILTRKGAFHTLCLTCFDCKRLLDSSSFSDGEDGWVYCYKCYSYKFGHMAKRAPTPAADPTLFPAAEGETKCDGCSGRLFDVEKFITTFGAYHKQCFKCVECHTVLDTQPAKKSKQGDIYCKSCYGRMKARTREAGINEDYCSYPPIGTQVIKASDDDPDKCPRCEGKVFEAEKMSMRASVYHKSCFTCGDCKRPMDYSMACIGPSNEIYCTNCYVRNFGNIGRMMDTETVSNTSLIKPVGDEKGCPRCGGAVFMAEVIISKGIKFHKKCAKCKLCEKTLQPGSLCAGHGDDLEIYCKGCYDRKYGGVGYRGALTGQWVDKKVSESMRPTVVDYTSIKAGEGDESCARCSGKVFEIERIIEKDVVYHKQCFNCINCNKSVASSLIRSYVGEDKQIYCKRCYKVNFGGSTTPAFTDTSLLMAVDGEGCPRCGGKVFEAEQVIEKGSNFHKSCFTCKTCRKPLNDKLQVFVGFDQEVYCKSCYPNISHTPLGPNDTSLIKGEEGDTEVCPRCDGKVFEAEKMKTKKLCFHNKCFNCRQCHHILDYNSIYEDKDGEIFCKLCYIKIFFTGGRNEYMNVSKKVEAGEGDPNACVKCNCKVYDAERVCTKAGSFHKLCLTCSGCNRMLDSSNYIDGPNKSVFCSSCYSTTYGHRSRSKTPGPLDYTQFEADDEDPNQCKGCKGKIFDAEKFLTAFGAFHFPCFKCVKCNASLQSRQDTSNLFNGTLMCKACFKREKSTGGDENGYYYINAFVDSTKIPAEDGDVDKCPRCGGKVFDAERMSMRNGQFHRKCFTCVDCGRNLDYKLATDGPEGDILCKPCYDKNYGPSTTRLDDTTYKTDIIKADDDSGCQRCGGAVFEPERVSSNGKNYHKKCAKCYTCNKLLDSRSLCNSSNGEIYCTGCHSRRFGGASYRGAGTNNWVDETATSTNRPEWVDPRKIKCDPGDANSCKRCLGKVYDLERVQSKNGIWHNTCFYCNGCRTALNSTLVMACESPDDQIYCKQCYTEAFGEGTIPLTYSDTTKIMPTSEEEGCVRCKGIVYEAEKIIAAENLWFHKGCFSCKSCKGKLDSLTMSIGPGDEVFCKTCNKRQLEIDNAKITTNTTFIMAEEGDKTACPRCGGKVYEAEKMATKNRWFHRQCFTCSFCQRKLNSSTMMDGPDDEIFCKTCYVRSFFTGGRNKFGDVGGVKAEEGDRLGCIICKNKVFEVDKVIRRNGVIHKQCLSCSSCNRNLGTSNFFDGSCGSIFCKNCYASKYGVHGRSESLSGPLTTTSIMAREEDADRCPRCSGRVFEAEKMTTSVGPFHKSCFRCIGCNRNLNQTSCNAGTDGEIYCKGCYSEEFGTQSRTPKVRSRHHSKARTPGSSQRASRAQSRNQIKSRSNSNFGLNDEQGHQIMAQSMIDTTSIKAQEGDENGCPRCGGKVFEAEKIISNRGIFHKICFTCEECRRGLDSMNSCAGPNNSLLCTNCYSRQHGPTARQFDEQLAKRMLESFAQQATDPKKACPRCSGTVYPNEELYSNGKSYHKKCAKCAGCERQLDFNTIYDGADKDIYCKGCYSRKFGTAGFRGIMTSTWVDEESSQSSRPTIPLNVITAEDDKMACIRCRGKVFDAEKVIASHGMFHRSCYRCADCSKALDSKSACDAPDREVYCRPCYGKNFGQQGYGFGGCGSVPVLIAGGEAKMEYHFTQFF